MVGQVQAALEPVLGSREAWALVQPQVVFESVAPGAQVRTLGAAVQDVLVIEEGLFEILKDGGLPEWAAPGAMLGIGASLTEAPSTLTVTARRYSRIARIPAAALWDHQGDLRASMQSVARLAQLPDSGLVALPPNPLVITAVLEGLNTEREEEIAATFSDAIAELAGGRFVARVHPTDPSSPDFAGELATHEAGVAVMVYLVRGGDEELGAALVRHADRVLLLQPYMSDATPSPARTLACDGTPGRHTELVYVESGQMIAAQSTKPILLPRHVQRTHILPYFSVPRLGLLLNELRRSARETDSLRDFALFSELTAAELAWVQRALRWERIDGGRLLAGSDSSIDDIWLVRAGRLEVFITTPAGERHIAWLGPGDIVGESSTLVGGRGNESVRAVRDSTVARLDRATAQALFDRSVGFARAVARAGAARASLAAGQEGGAGRRARTFTLLPLTDPERARRFADELVEALRSEGLDATVVDASRVNFTLGKDAASTRRGEVGDGEIIAWLDELERHHDTVLLVCGAETDSWARRAVRQCDHVLLVADAMTSPERRSNERTLLGDSASDTSAWSVSPRDDDGGFAGGRHLILLQRAGIHEASGTGDWLAERPYHTHHHVRAGDRNDLARLARRLTNRAVALALSGAASRAPAHFGVARALRDHGIPIDIVSGSSSGAGIASLIATGMPTEEALTRAITAISAGAPKIRQLQPPITSFTSGAMADRLMQQVYENRQLEDQLIPAVLTAVDIRRHRLVLLTHGPIWKLVRASGSLPLIWPPVWHEDNLLVDGGIISHLPAQVFGQQADAGLIVASNLGESAGTQTPAFDGALQYGSTMSGWGELGRRMRRSSAPRPPALLEILFHAMSIPSFQSQEGLADLAARDNVCILQPPVGSFGLFEVTAAVGRSLEKVAWEYSKDALADVAAAWAQRQLRSVR